MKEKFNIKLKAQTEGGRGALWWMENYEKYDFLDNEYAGKMIAVTSKGIIGSAENLEKLIEEMRARGLEPKRDYYPTFCYDDESTLELKGDLDFTETK